MIELKIPVETKSSTSTIDYRDLCIQWLTYNCRSTRLCCRSVHKIYMPWLKALFWALIWLSAPTVVPEAIVLVRYYHSLPVAIFEAITGLFLAGASIGSTLWAASTWDTSFPVSTFTFETVCCWSENLIVGSIHICRVNKASGRQR